MKRKIAVTVLVLGLFLVMYGNERGLTCKPLAEPAEASGVKAQEWRGAEHIVNQQTADFDREGWELADSININTFLPAGEHIEVEYTSLDNQLNIIHSFDGLTAQAKNAIDKSPVWMRAELETRLASLEEEYQVFWANVINEVDDPYIDEVAFAIATSSYDYLTSDYAYPEMYIQNAEMIYEYDQDLSYVEVIDYGNSLTDEDYYTTTRYWSKDANGVVHQTEVPREIYYWHIVHPKITDEIPAFINPELTESNSTHNTNIVSPEDGYFWRDFLYNYADDGYPVLRNYLMQCEYANDYTTGYDSAIGACTQWLAQSLQFTSNYERPHQPVRIYRKHIGRCGEHADMRVAIGRAALIPMTSIVCFTVDHTWNEFWDGEWIHWDGGSINNYYMYENGWGSNFGSVIDVRSDGLMSSVTQKYAPNYANLTVYALDGAGKPMDGARILIGLRLNNQITGDMVGWTDNEGKYEFPIGDGHEYWVSMSTAWGSVEYQLVTENTVGGDEYNVELQVSAITPDLNLTEIDMPADDFEDYRLVVEYEADNQVIYGNIVMDDTSEDTWFYHRKDQGAVNFFMSDMIHYYSYVSGLDFEAFNTIEESDFGMFAFDMPSPEYGSWYAVIDNTTNIVNPQWVKGSIALYRWEGTGGSANIHGVVSDDATGTALAGASVTARGFSTLTNDAGEYSLDVYPGVYDVVIAHPFYETVRINDYEVSDGETFELSISLFDNPIMPLNITVTGDDNTDAEISWDAPESLLNRSLQGYRVYRLLSEDEDEPESWEEITEGIITETSFTDTDWQSLEAGVYRYGVCAVYSEYSSDFAVTQELAYDMMANVQINISTNSGDSAEGAEITFENTDGVNSPYNYDFTYISGGLEAEVWKGSYDFFAELEHFAGYYDSLLITEDVTINIELEELLTGVSFPGVVDYMLRWDGVPQMREFQNYKVYIDNDEEPLLETTDNFCSLEELDASEHTAAIEAVYSSGVSELVAITFIDGSSLAQDQLAYFSFDEDMADSISGWQGTSDTVELTSSPFGNAAEFAGDDYITIPANPELMESALHYTTIFWVYGTEENTGWRGLLGRPGRNQCAWVNGDNEYVHHRFHTMNGGTNDGAPNTPNSSFDWQEWQQIAIVNDGFVAKTYINGELLAQSTLNSALVADSTDMYIGKSPDSPTAAGYFWGQIDEVRIWNRGLSSGEIESLYLGEIAALGVGDISGVVTDIETGEVLQGVHVRSGIFRSVTDENGYYSLAGLPSGFHDIYVSFEDFLELHIEEVFLEAGQSLEYDIEYELTGNDENEIIVPSGKIISYPNPFYGSSSRAGITFILNSIEAVDNAEMKIYNIRGQEINSFYVSLISGNNTIVWDTCDDNSKVCGSGVYFYRLSSNKESLKGKLLILR